MPPYPGVQCALGCAIADIQYDLARTVERRADALDDAWIDAVLAEQREQGEAQLASGGARIDRVDVRHTAEMAYAGQIHALRVPIERHWPVARMVEAFHAVYAREYGNTLGGIPVVIVSIKTTVRGGRDRPTRTPAPLIETQAIASATRNVWFDGWHETAIYARAILRPGHVFTGPAIIEQADTTAVIEPGMRARVDGFDNILVEIVA